MNFVQKLGNIASFGRRCLVNQRNVRFLSGVEESNITPVAAVPEKDKLFSRLEIEVKGIDPEVMKSYAWFATTAANNLGINVGKCWAERKSRKDRLTLLKSVHVYKKHRVQYEVRTYFRFMNFHNMTSSTLDTFLEYIERNLPEGCAIKATKVEIQKLPEHLAQN
ncbi:unnamed protein product [Diamesa tonsa]